MQQSVEENKPLMGDQTPSGTCSCCKGLYSHCKELYSCWKEISKCQKLFICLVVVSLPVILTVSVLSFVNLYGNSTCDSSSMNFRRGEPMCYCDNFDAMWACEEEEKPNDIFREGYFEQLDRFHFYFVLSIVRYSLLAIVAVILLLSRKKANNSQGTASRSEEKSKELYLQWKILLFFIVGSVLHSTFTCIMMTGCTGYEISRLQIGDAVCSMIFKIATVIYLGMEVSIRRQLETVIMRSLSAFLGSCSLILLVTTLVDSACLKHLNNEHIISDDNWEAIKPFFFAMDIGMYGQCFAIYLPIAFERGSESEEQEGELTEQENSNANLNVICQKDVEKGLMRIATGGGILFVVVIYFLTAVYALSPKNEDFRYVSAIQITLHIGIGISSLFLIVTIRRDLNRNEREVCCCHCRNFGIMMEEIVYIFYFSGAMFFNGFSFGAYQYMLKKEGENDERIAGAVEAIFGLISVILQFTVIRHLKQHQEGQRNQSSHDLCSTTKKYCIALRLLLVMSVALAGADFVREDFDKDEKDFKRVNKRLFIGYDLLYPLVVDFRLHSAIMIFCIFEENRQKKKRHSSESGQHRQSSSCSAVANSTPPQTETTSQHVPEPQRENSQHSSPDLQIPSQRQPLSSKNPQIPSKLQKDQQDSQPLPKKLGTRSAKPQAKSNSQESRLQELQSRPEDPPPPSKDSQKLAQGLRTPSEHSQTWSTEPQSPVSRTTDAFTRIEEKSTGVAETIN